MGRLWHVLFQYPATLPHQPNAYAQKVSQYEEAIAKATYEPLHPELKEFGMVT